MIINDYINKNKPLKKICLGKNNKSLIVFNNLNTLNFFLINLLSNFTKTTNKINLLLSGGKSLNKFLKQISSNEIIKKQINIYLTDERIVKRNSYLSNEKTILKCFKRNIKIKHSFFSLIDHYKSGLKNIYKAYPKPENIDLCIMGVGSDGHIASISIKSKKIEQHKTFFKCNRNNEKYNRISISLNYLTRIPVIIILIHDNKKINILKSCLNLQKKSTLPITDLIQKGKGKIYILTSKYYMNQL